MSGGTHFNLVSVLKIHVATLAVVSRLRPHEVEVSKRVRSHVNIALTYILLKAILCQVRREFCWIIKVNLK